MIADYKGHSGGGLTGSSTPSFSAQAPPESREAVKYKVLQVSRVVVSVRESAAIVEDILRAGQPVGLDGEGVNLGPKGQLTLVQVSTVQGQVIIFDVQTTPALLTQGGLQRLLESEQVIKVMIYVLFLALNLLKCPNLKARK